MLQLYLEWKKYAMKIATVIATNFLHHPVKDVPHALQDTH
jgi:hypothetical protein